MLRNDSGLVRIECAALLARVTGQLLGSPRQKPGIGSTAPIDVLVHLLVDRGAEKTLWLSPWP